MMSKATGQESEELKQEINNLKMALVEKEKSIAIKVEEAFGMKDLIERQR